MTNAVRELKLCKPFCTKIMNHLPKEGRKDGKKKRKKKKAHTESKDVQSDFSEMQRESEKSCFGLILTISTVLLG